MGKTGKSAEAKASSVEERAVPENTPEQDAVPLSLSSEDVAAAAKYDLTGKITPYLDRHLVIPILNFLAETGIYNKDDITRAEISLLTETNMIEYAVEKYALIGEEAPESLCEEQKQMVLTRLSESQQRVLKLLIIFEDEEKLYRLRNFKSLSDICRDFEFHDDVFDNLFDYAKMQFDCGNYALAENLLKHYQNIMSQDAEQPPSWRQTSSMWGQLACFILNSSSDHEEEHGATYVMSRIDEFLEKAERMPKREVLCQRTWLLHWALFCIFQSPRGNQMKPLDLILSERSMVIMSLACPHLFRYVGACLVLHKRVKHLTKDTVRILSQESRAYSDPITRFLVSLYEDINFDEAQHALRECEIVFCGDYFLRQYWNEFNENARLLVFESYCRIHQCINIAMIAEKLNMEAAEAELWIVKLIQNAKLDARIDSENSRVVMTKAPPSVYQQVIDKTKDLSFRSTMLLSHLDKREIEKKAALKT
eukprot:TRINITY_DN67374_c0_g1_i1.p1 TRINITY_DN67374_c0_g1~~TRINITY_DN67374_c0_g1_i1.p1  ORF type:complete len:480 (-),score=91.97 TRINITY_DN67374_c0_g1_i1:217-1656(-)